MELIIQKFGGTSVANIDRIRNVASIIQSEISKGNKVVVVVSAMAGVTDQLTLWANELIKLTSDSSLAELDTILATGEQVTAGLLAMLLQSMGLKSRSYLGWQIPIKCNNQFGKSRIEEINTEFIKERLSNDEVPVIAGFQGVTKDGRIVTLGRGGSDTTAVALAHSIGANRCDIYTDVDGVYTADPRIVSNAKKLSKVTYEEMLEMASLGAKVLHIRAVEIAMKYKIPIQVLSSFSSKGGSMIVDNMEIKVENQLVTSINHSRQEAVVSLRGIPYSLGIVAEIFTPLSEENINVDMIIQNTVSGNDEVDITFTVLRKDIEQTKKLLSSYAKKLNYRDLIINENVAKISIIGVGMVSHPGVAKKMFCILAEKGIDIMAISTSEIKISVLISEEYTELALRALHNGYGLDTE